LKVKTTKITLPNKDYDEKLSKLEKHNDYQRIDILDESASNTFKINVPVLYRDESVKLNLPCTIHIKKKLYTVDITVYSDVTKPLIITLAMGFLFVFISIMDDKSIEFSLFIFILATSIIGGTFLFQIRKQTRKKIREWFW
jgi:hypothetical protein